MSGTNILDTFKAKLPVTGIIAKLGYMPDSPTDCIVLNVLGGDTQIKHFGNSKTISFPIVSVKVRSSVYDTGIDACTLIKNTMKNIADTDFLGVRVLTDTTDLGKDDKERNYFELQFQVIIEE